MIVGYLILNKDTIGTMPSVLCRCWLGGRKGIQPVKLSGGMLAWLCVWVKVQICIWPSWCHCHALSLAAVNPDWFYLPVFTFLELAHLDKIQEDREMVVCLCVYGTMIYENTLCESNQRNIIHTSTYVFVSLQFRYDV